MVARMKTIEVVAAIIHDSNDRIFATQRGYGDMKGGWEFPGGNTSHGSLERISVFLSAGKKSSALTIIMPSYKKLPLLT